jgi:two-component system, OmpR family, phosphate regulon sensor histidine kinase PhoR
VKKSNYIHFITRTLLFLLLFTCAFAAAYGLTRLIFRVTGQPPEFVDHIVSGLTAIILMSGSWILFFLIHHWSKPGRDWHSIIDTQLKSILEAINRISRGDFDVFVSSEHERDPYKEVAESINKMAKELGSMERLRQDFISNVSHEIHSPLTSISGYASLLKNEGISREQIAHYAMIIEAESKRLSKLSDNLLQLSVLEEGIVPLEIKPFRLDKQLESILLMLEPQWAGKNISLDVSLPAVTAFGNEDLLSQVWINLLHNAIKFTPHDGTILVELTSNHDNVLLRIADSGIGIPPEDQIHIFERFYKVDKSRDRSLGGNGLGLSLVKKIAELHKGQVHVESEVGKGSVFTVTLPIEKESGKAS